jgi:hypothetical protein
MEDNKDIAKRRAALNYLLSQIFGQEDYNELQQHLIQVSQNNSEPFVEQPEITEQEQVNYPGFTGKRFTALQRKIETLNKPEELNEESIDATGR